MQPIPFYALLDAIPSVDSAHSDSWIARPDSASADVAIDRDLPEEVAAYAIRAGRVYFELRRLLGQIAGLLILAQASNRRQALDLPIVAAATELWLSMPEQMERLRAPSQLDANLRHLKSAHRRLGTCLESLKASRLKDERIDLTDALEHLARAYSHLRSASDPRVGMTMVDFSNACCNCGQSNPKTSLSTGG